MAELNNNKDRIDQLNKIDRLREQSDKASRIHRQSDEVNEKLIESLSNLNLSDYPFSGSKPPSILENIFEFLLRFSFLVIFGWGYWIIRVIFSLFCILVLLNYTNLWNVIPDTIHWGWVLFIGILLFGVLILFGDIDFTIDLNTSNTTPLQQKYMELDKTVVKLQKEYSECKDEVEKEKISEEVYLLTDIYQDHKNLIRFAYDISLDTRRKEYKELLVNIEKKELTKLQSDKYIQNVEKQKLSSNYQNKCRTVSAINYFYVFGFLSITGGYVGFLVQFLLQGTLPSQDMLVPFLVLKAPITVSITVVVCWIAKFFNRRLHENVQLIEEYSHRALLLDSFDMLLNSVSSDEQKKEILNKVMDALIKTPAHCLFRPKADKIPTELIELAKILKS